MQVDAVKRLKFAKLNPSASAEKIAEMTGGVEFKLSDDALEASFAAGTFKGVRSLPGTPQVTSPTSSTPPTTTSQRSARATWLENTTLKVAVESLIDTHFHKTKGTDYNCARVPPLPVPAPSHAVAARRGRVAALSRLCRGSVATRRGSVAARCGRVAALSRLVAALSRLVAAASRLRCDSSRACRGCRAAVARLSRGVALVSRSVAECRRYVAKKSPAVALLLRGVAKCCRCRVPSFSCQNRDMYLDTHRRGGLRLTEGVRGVLSRPSRPGPTP